MHGSWEWPIFFLEERLNAQEFLDQKITENGNKIKI